MEEYYYKHTEEREGFLITFYARPEDLSPSDVYEEEVVCDYQNLLIQNGDISWFRAEVVASINGIILAQSSLGCCAYESYQEFIADQYYTDMVDEVISQAKETIINLNKRVSKIFS